MAVGALPLVSPQRRAYVERPNLDFSFVAPTWIRPEWATSVDLPARWRSDVSPVKLRSSAQRARFARYTLARPHVNVDNLLALAAQTGVELRHPFHDLRLTHFLMGVPADMFRLNGLPKYLLRTAMRGTLPEVVRTRRSKTGFGQTILRALQQLLATTRVSDLQPVKMGWVDATGFERTLAQWHSWYGSDRRRAQPWRESCAGLVHGVDAPLARARCGRLRVRPRRYPRSAGYPLLVRLLTPSSSIPKPPFVSETLNVVIVGGFHRASGPCLRRVIDRMPHSEDIIKAPVDLRFTFKRAHSSVSVSRILNARG